MLKRSKDVASLDDDASKTHDLLHVPLGEEGSTKTKDTDEQAGVDGERTRASRADRDAGLRRAARSGLVRRGGRVDNSSRVTSGRVSRSGVEVSSRVDRRRGSVVNSVGVDAGGADVDY